MKSVRVLSLGAGVQSTCIALMIHRGDLPPIDFAVFADPQEESSATYRHLQWLIEETKVSFPTIINTAGRLGDHLKVGRNKHGGRFVSIPCYQSNPGSNICTGVGRRQCTKEYKIEVVWQAIRNELGLKRKQRMQKDVEITQVIGMSWDEPARVARVIARFEEDGKSKPEFPLFDLKMTRDDCVNWMRNYGVEHEVPRSACVFCPYKLDLEWAKLKAEDPDGWSRAVEIDRALRVPGNVVNRRMQKVMWLHRDCVPLESIDFTKDRNRRRDDALGQLRFDFSQECEGMCGS